MFNFFILLDAFFLVFMTSVEASKYLREKNRQTIFATVGEISFLRKKAFLNTKKKLESPSLTVFGRMIHENLSKFTKLKSGLGCPRWIPLFIDNTK